MLYFNPKPNFQLLSKYYTFPEAPEIMQEQYPDGYPIVIDWYDTDEKVERIENEFKAILAKYKLSLHYDNLLLLALTKMQQIEAIVYELSFQYEQKKRTKELASLLITLSEESTKNGTSFLLKTLFSTTKVTDQKLVGWIKRTLIREVANGNLPASEFDFSISKTWFHETESGSQLNIQTLKQVESTTLTKPGKKIKGLHADFCLYLYQYLVSETNIKPNPNVLFSDSQLMFYFDMLVLFQYVDPSKVESDYKDYVSALLRNKINAVNAIPKGNKTK